MSKYGIPIWRHVLNAALELDKAIFSPKNIIVKIHKKNPEIPANSIRTYVIAMAPNHPSSPYYPTTHKKHRYFEYLGTGKFRLLKGEITIKPPPDCPKDAFLRKYNDTIFNWTINNEEALINGRKNYSWGGKSLIESIEGRNNISRLILKSRIENQGGVDLKTLDDVMSWGGFGSFPLRDNEEVLRITTEAFDLLDMGDLSGAILILLNVSGIGISSGSKIIGLYDQFQLAIYDSRVGTALRTLKHDEKRILKCPPGRSRPGDTCKDKQWAESYQTLIWTLEIMRNHLNHQGYPFCIADVEMALFMVGK